MAEIKEFVVNDRRKFTAEGEVRPDAPPSEPKPASSPDASPDAASAAKPSSAPHLVERPAAAPTAEDELPAPPPLTAEQTSQATSAYEATVARLDTAIRATNPGMEKLPEMTFDRVLQSLYMQTMLQLGGVVEQGQKPQLDLLGARQTIDMLAVLSEKTKGNLTPTESTLLDNILFESRMGFLEVTQALARQAQQAQLAQTSPAPGTPPGPSIVR